MLGDESVKTHSEGMSVVACSGFNCLFACSLLLDFDIVLVATGTIILLAVDCFYLLSLLLLLLLLLTL